MKSTLPDLYRSIDEQIQRVYVFPRIPLSSIWNPYLGLLYKEFLEPDKNNTGIDCVSPHPLMPLFIIKRIFGEKNMVHYHWLEFSDVSGLITLFWKMGLLLIYKAFGGNIVWTVHNRRPHRNRFSLVNSLFYRLMAKMAARIHVHSQEAVRIMQPTLNAPEEKFSVIDHPQYPVKIVNRAQAINHLQQTMQVSYDSSRPLFLVYGVIASYKGVIPIIKACIANNCQLVIAGRSLTGEHAYLKQVRSLCDNYNDLYLCNRHLSKEDEANLFGAADCVVFNYTETLSSGTVILAQCYKKEIIIPNRGCLKDMEGDGIYRFNTIDELKKLISSYSPQAPQRGL